MWFSWRKLDMTFLPNWQCILKQIVPLSQKNCSMTKTIVLKWSFLILFMDFGNKLLNDYNTLLSLSQRSHVGACWVSCGHYRICWSFLHMNVQSNKNSYDWNWFSHGSKNRPFSNCVRTKEQSWGWVDKFPFFFVCTKEIANLSSQFFLFCKIGKRPISKVCIICRSHRITLVFCPKFLLVSPAW